MIISSKSLPICNRFHARRVNGGKIAAFWRVPLFLAIVQGQPLASGTKFCHKILQTLRYIRWAWKPEAFISSGLQSVAGGVAVLARNIWGKGMAPWQARQREPITGTWGQAPSGVQGRAPGQGTSPLKQKHFWFLDVQWKPQICPLF